MPPSHKRIRVEPNGCGKRRLSGGCLLLCGAPQRYASALLCARSRRKNGPCHEVCLARPVPFVRMRRASQRRHAGCFGRFLAAGCVCGAPCLIIGPGAAASCLRRSDKTSPWVFSLIIIAVAGFCARRSQARRAHITWMRAKNRKEHTRSQCRKSLLQQLPLDPANQ